jgi:hypothetical protein
VLSILRYTDSDYRFRIFKLFLQRRRLKQLIANPQLAVFQLNSGRQQAQQYILKEKKGMPEGWAQRRDGPSGAITFDCQKQKIMNKMQQLGQIP